MTPFLNQIVGNEKEDGDEAHLPLGKRQNYHGGNCTIDSGKRSDQQRKSSHSRQAEQAHDRLDEEITFF